MKTWAAVAMLALFAAQGHADSLGEAAKREQERREKAKHENASPAPKVIHEEELVAGSGKDSKGTFNPAAGSGSGAAGSNSAQPGAYPILSGPGNNNNTEVDQLRVSARRRLESSYQAISGTASSFVSAVQEYIGSRCTAQAGTRRCTYLYQTIGKMGVTIATEMDQAEDAARTGWLNPGEVRAMREKYRMSSSFWDELVRLVNEYRH